MNKEHPRTPTARLRRAIEGFRNFCDEDLEWRTNSGEPFDQDTFVEARDLVMQRLEQLQEDAE